MGGSEKNRCICASDIYLLFFAGAFFVTFFTGDFLAAFFAATFVAIVFAGELGLITFFFGEAAVSFLTGFVPVAFLAASTFLIFHRWPVSDCSKVPASVSFFRAALKLKALIWVSLYSLIMCFFMACREAPLRSFNHLMVSWIITWYVGCDGFASAVFLAGAFFAGAFLTGLLAGMFSII